MGVGAMDKLAAGGPKAMAAWAQEQVGEPEGSLALGYFPSSYHSGRETEAWRRRVSRPPQGQVQV